jgi:hypothetical protein
VGRLHHAAAGLCNSRPARSDARRAARLCDGGFSARRHCRHCHANGRTDYVAGNITRLVLLNIWIGYSIGEHLGIINVAAATVIAVASTCVAGDDRGITFDK